MGVNINWGMAQPTNYSNSLLSGMQAGRQIAQQQHSDNALAAYQQNPDAPGAINALASADPQRASAMLQVRQSQQQAADQQAQRAAAKGITGPDGKIKTTAAADYVATTGDTAGAAHIQSFIDSAGKEQRARAADSSGAIATAGNQVAQLPYEQRKAALLQMAPMLAQHGVAPEMLQNFDPTDGNISTAVNQSLGLKAALDRADTVDDDQFKHEKQAEDVRHHKATEGLGAGNLQVRQGALSLAGQRRGDHLAGAAGGSSLPDVSGVTDDELVNLAAGR